MTKESVVAGLLARLPKALPAMPGVRDYPTVRLASPGDLLPAARLLKDELGFTYLEMVTAVDLLGRPGASGRPVLDLLWLFGNIPERLKVFLRLETPRDGAQAPSLTGLFPAADWQERETYDLFGVRYAGHPNLSKILTPDFLIGHPLRKDYAHQKDVYDVPG